MSGKVCTVSVVNWDTYQHYKDRNPPWIKLHNRFLEDPGIAALPDASKGHLLGIWLLASRLDNKIPGDPGFIGRRINANSKVDLNLLIRMSFLEWSCGCLQHASGMLATCTTETEERQSRGETKTEAERVSPEQLIFDHWRTATGKRGAKLDDKRRRVIAAMLKAGYVADDLRRAIDGCMASPWHQGKNPDSRVYNSLTLILRDAEHVDMFMALAGKREGLGLPSRASFDDAETA